MKKIIKCEKCGSLRIMKLRIDSDWSTGVGDYDTVNEDKYYTEEELKYDSFDRPDIVVYHCLDCDSLFE